jgi:hypothetical protein
VGGKRIVSISWEEVESGGIHGVRGMKFTHTLIKEISRYPNIEMEEVPFSVIVVTHDYQTISKAYNAIDNRNLLNNGIVIFYYIPDSYNKYRDYEIIRLKDNLKTKYSLGKLYLKAVKRDSKSYAFKKLGYIITVPLDIVTFPFQLIFYTILGLSVS